MRALLTLGCLALFLVLQGCSSVHIVEASGRYQAAFLDTSTAAPDFKQSAFPKRLLLSVPKQDLEHWSAVSPRLAALDAALTACGSSIAHGPISGLPQAELEALARDKGCDGVLVFEAFGWPPESVRSRYFAGGGEVLNEVSRGVWEALSDGPNFRLNLENSLLEVQGDLFVKGAKTSSFEKKATFLATGSLIDMPHPGPFTQRIVWSGGVVESSTGTPLSEVFGRQAILQVERLMLRDLIGSAGN